MNGYIACTGLCSLSKCLSSNSSSPIFGLHSRGSEDVLLGDLYGEAPEKYEHTFIQLEVLVGDSLLIIFQASHLDQLTFSL